MHLTTAILLFCSALATVSADCTLTKNDVESTTHIFAIGSLNRFSLLLTDTVSQGTNIYMLCPNGKPTIVPATCGSNGYFQRQLPVGNCPAHEAVVIKIQDNSCAQQSYGIGYIVNGQFLEVYRTCYDQQAMRVLHTTHRAEHYSLVTNRPNETFHADGIITPAEAETYNRANVRARFLALFGPSQTYIPPGNVTVISRGHLTPSADYLFIDDMRSTFRYINAVPQFQSINSGNWKKVENWVRRRLKSVSRATIITGAHDVLALKDANNNLVPVYLAPNNRNPIPKWMYKIVKDASGSVVFLTYNNIYNSVPEIFSGTCIRALCPIDIELRNRARSGFTVCCDPATFQV